MQTIKGLGTLFALVISLFILTPTFLGLKSEKAKLKEAGQELPWYHGALPEKELNLGLDLRGGIYIEMEVGIEDAMDHHVNFLLSDIKRFVFRDDLEKLSGTKVSKDSVRVEMETDQRSALESSLLNTFGPSQFNVVAEANEIFYTVTGNPNAKRKAFIEKLQSLYDNPTLVPEVGLTKDRKHIGVAFRSETEKQNIENVFTEETKGTPENVVYIRLTEARIAQIKKDVIEQAAQSVRNRIDRFGLAETQVSRQGQDRLVIEIPGESDPTRIIDLVRRTGKLEFRLVDTSKAPAELQALVSAKINELNITRPYEIDSLKKLNAALKADLPNDAEVLFFLTRDPSTKEVVNSTPYLIKKKADVTGDMLDNASISSQSGKPYVALNFNKTGTKNFGEVTKNNVGRELAIVLDDTVMSTPRIQDAILSGSASISLGVGSFQELYKEAEDLTKVLKEGALPASLKVASKNIVGPSLGQDSIDAGITSILISGAGVLVFMLLYYRLGGLIANLSLILNIILIFAGLCLMGASLTLPGMAGIVLTLGMAVDANVIIFERMREEKNNHAHILTVIDTAYSSAISAIVDGNVTTFIAAIFLFEFGTGPIKGFATTLMIGIASTLFTAIVVSRFLYDWAATKMKLKGIGF